MPFFLKLVFIIYIAPSGAPQNVSGISTSSQSVYLSWNPPPVTLQNGIIRKYFINIMEVDRGLEFEYMTRSTEFEITELNPYYTYEIWVSAYTIALGPSSDRISVLTLEDGEFRIDVLIMIIFYDQKLPQFPVDHP